MNMTPPTAITLAEYKQALSFHDWYYHWSDDSNVYHAGAREQNRLYFIAEQLGDDYKRAFNEAYASRFDVKPPRSLPFTLPA